MINKEDKADVKRSYGKAIANKVHKATDDSKNKGVDIGAQKRRGMASKGGFIERLEAHKAEGRSFDDGTYKAKKGQSFTQALEAHKAKREFD